MKKMKNAGSGDPAYRVYGEIDGRSGWARVRGGFCDGRLRRAALLPLLLLGTSCAGQNMVLDAKSPAGTAPVASSPASPAALAARGHTLFLMNCAHCHAADATGDEGPDLHGLHKSDARLADIIKNGIKGEMPKFNAKLTDADVRGLTAFIHSLK